MPRAKRPKRRYDSRRRREQAEATRRSILDAAERLFVRSGYPATTMEAIAAEAGVAVKTVYIAFATKSGLLRSLWDLRLKGDLDETPVGQRDWYRQILEETDPERQLDLVAHNSRLVKERIGLLLRVIRTAATVDEPSAELWQLIQDDFYENQRTIVRALSRSGRLRPELDVDRASDILWTLNHPDVWLLLAGERGWTPDDFEPWFASATKRLLLADGRAPTTRT